VSATDPQEAVREALASVRRYLSDSIPPLTAADSVTLLLDQPPELVAQEVRSWIAAQRGPASGNLPVSDYVFHALKKLHEMGQLKLVPAEPLRAYLESLKTSVLDCCPAEQRDSLAQSLRDLDQAETLLAPAISYVHRRVDAGDSQHAAAGTGGPETAEGQDAGTPRGSRRFSLLLERLQRESPAAVGGSAEMPDAGDEQVSRILAAAASDARTEAEFRQVQEALSMTGAGSGVTEVFRRLSRSLPAWCVSVKTSTGTGTKAAAQNPALAAMLQIMHLAEDSQETGRRFQEMVRAGIEQFNTGSLARAVTLLELAGSLAAEGNIDAGLVARIRSTAHESLDFQRLRNFAEKPETYFLLGRVLSHFDEMAPERLLDKLRTEPKRDRRRMLLNLLEAHGPAARVMALRLLEEEAQAENLAEDWYLARNLICILNRVPPPEETDLESEVALIASFLKLTLPAPLIREAISHLGQMHHGTEEQLLVDLLEELQRKLLETGAAGPESAKFQSLLDRVVSVLAKYGTAGARRAAVNHGLSRREEYGDTLARLSYLAGEDLSGDEESVGRLLGALKTRIPVKLLGMFIHRDARDPLPLIKALSSTASPAVRSALERIARDFPQQEFGRAASKALRSFDSDNKEVEVPAERLLGDLELFGLPDLLQQFARSRLTGTLTLKDRRGETVGTISIRRGQLMDCSTGLLEGRAAVYQLLASPVHGTFVFMRRKSLGTREEPDEPPGEDVMPLIQEGTRRHDELQRACALVPDGSRFKPTGTEPMPQPDEVDTALFRRIWDRVRAGASAEECEASSPADAYRIRLLLARWVEDAILVVEPGGSPS
jgi:hypothetical protein